VDPILRPPRPLPPPVPEPPPLHTQHASSAPAGSGGATEVRPHRTAITWEEPVRRRRWPLVVLVVAGAGLAFVSIAGGVARATADAAAQANQLAEEGHYAQAIALDYHLASLGGPLLFLDRADVSSAPSNAQRTMLKWAGALAGIGKIDQAVALTSAVTDPRLQADASHERASVLLHAAMAAAQQGDFVTAVRRLRQILQTDAATSEARQANSLLPDYQVGEASALTAAGRGADAVAILDAVSSGPATVSSQKAAGVYPAALLAAGQEEIAATSYKEAQATLKRLTDMYGGTPQAAQARTLLNAHQSVTGTLAQKNGQPISGRVRLSRHFTSVPGGYLTSGPFYYSNADRNGNFSIGGVPVGGPYVLEVFHDGNWTTLIDPSTGQPADPVMVAPLEPAALTFIVIP
jgi:tetratricopeptide (TPR) repeat protein